TYGLDRFLHRGRGHRGIVVRRRTHLDLRLRVRSDLPRPGANLLAERGDLRRGEIAQLDYQLHRARHDVRRVRRDVQLPDRSHLPPRLAPHDLVDRNHELGSGHQRVLPLGHRGGAGVIGEPADFDVVAVDGNDPLYDADIEAGLLQHAALLDVQLDIAGER